MLVIEWDKAIPHFVTSLNFLAIALVIGALALLVGPPLLGRWVMARSRRKNAEFIAEYQKGHTREFFLDSPQRGYLPPARKNLVIPSGILRPGDKILLHAEGEFRTPAGLTAADLAFNARSEEQAKLLDAWRRPGLLQMTADYEGIEPPRLALSASERQAEPVQSAVVRPAEGSQAYFNALATPTDAYRLVVEEGELVEDLPLTEADRAFLADPLGSWVLPPVETIEHLPLADETFRALIDANWGHAAAQDIDAEWRAWDLYDEEEVLV
jgi:hypothetical protein